MAQLADTAFGILGSAPLPPQAKFAVAAVDTDNQQALRKGLNTGMIVLLGIVSTISLAIAIGLLATAKEPRLNDGRWWGGWSVLVLAAIPLISMTVWIAVRNSECEGDVVGALANFGPGKIGKVARTAQQFQ